MSLAAVAQRVSSNAYLLEVECDDRFDVRHFTVHDGLSSLFRIDCAVVSENPAVDFEATVGKPASFRIRAAQGVEGPAAQWTGIVSAIHQRRAEQSGLSTYDITLVPRLWLLTQRTNCRVFQQMSDLDIVRSLLEEWGIDPVVETTRAFKTRKCRVQYQETDHAFMSRMLEAAGVTYFFRRTEDGSALVLKDAPETGARRTEPLEHTDEPLAGTLHATRFVATRAVRAGKITLADHDHRGASGPVLAGAATSAVAVEQTLEHFAYVPGAFRFGNPGPKDTPVADDRGRTRTDPDEAKRIAEQAAFARVARSKRFGFQSNAVDLAAGMRLRVGGHPVADSEAELLIVSVAITALHDQEPRVACQAVSAATPYRPEVATTAPSILSVECATVVGPAGETIHCDEFGRVRIQFHWDRYGTRDEQSSCWVPVTQAWAGDALGSLNLPRVGQEVLIGFLGGNPEEPIVVGRLFTNLLRPPFSLPANKTQNGFRSASVPATGGYNELMFEDKAGDELFHMRAERNMKTHVNRSHTTHIGKDRSASIAGHDSEAIEGNQNHSVAGKLVSSVLGSVASSIGQDMVKSVLGSMLSSAGGQRILDTLGDYVSQALSHRISSEVGTTLTVGQSMIHIGPDSIVIQSPKVLLNPGESVAASAALGEPVQAPDAE